jgi:hypothetical protein
MHRRIHDEQARLILSWYDQGQLSGQEACAQLGCKRSRFFEILTLFRADPSSFSVRYRRTQPNRRIATEIEKAIADELRAEQALIRNPDIPVRFYNYREVRDAVIKKTQRIVSAQTVRNRAKAWGFTNPSKPKRTASRRVETEALGQLLQHDSSYHQWSPYAPEKWHLITTIDDYSRLLLHASLVKEETTWTHIQALQDVLAVYGIGANYYVDNHSIFRFVQFRESVWQKRVLKTDEVITDWKRAVELCGMKVWYASTPQAKGKIERPYRWLQDRIVRRCAKENIKTLPGVRMILEEVVAQYNEK